MLKTKAGRYAPCVIAGTDAVPPREASFFITGPRPKDLGGYPKDIVDYEVRYHHLKLALMGVFAKECEAGRANLWCGMAQGVDQIAADVALDMAAKGWPVRVSAAVPVRGQASPWGSSETSPFSKPWYDRLLARIATQGPVVLTNDGPYSPRLMYARNEFMADSSAACVAVWPKARGPWEDAPRSGTASAMRYARRVGLPITVIGV